ncbi:hypothetical protein K402DRAFT_393767 [Aulographum hederae CBS 113979]|uniref:Uncharacterized protein n=1 Tax=Aulographum hederae CBS 113979 TaxID=1176131 RepID=A0A6G1GZ90_9PEZI|nr:hypothetical protein K402DRAFT_393767 [Aulographum hederae CBS 113979]
MPFNFWTVIRIEHPNPPSSSRITGQCSISRLKFTPIAPGPRPTPFTAIYHIFASAVNQYQPMLSVRNSIHSYREALIGLLTRRRLLFSAVEWNELQQLILAGNSAIEDLLVTSRRTAVHHIIANYNLYRGQIQCLLRISLLFNGGAILTSEETIRGYPVWRWAFFPFQQSQQKRREHFLVLAGHVHGIGCALPVTISRKLSV